MSTVRTLDHGLRPTTTIVLAVLALGAPALVACAPATTHIATGHTADSLRTASDVASAGAATHAGSAVGAAPDFAAGAARDRAAAQADTTRLVSQFRLPPGSVPVSGTPYPYLAAPLGGASNDDVVDITRYWRVPLSMDRMHAWLLAHLPRHVTPDGSGSGGGGDEPYSIGYSFRSVPNPVAPLNDRAEFGVAAQADRSGSIWQVDAAVGWYDPTPELDGRDGGHRGSTLHVDATGPCPVSIGKAVDVSNTGRTLAYALLPTAPVTGALICNYEPVGSGQRLAGHVALAGQAASTLADQARALPVGRSHGGERSCVYDDGSNSVIVFALGGQVNSTVDLWFHDGGCQGVDNGTIIAMYEGLTLPG